MRRFGALLLVLLPLGGGCARATLRASATQPNPLLNADVLMESEHLHITVRDMDLPHFYLQQSAYFVVKSNDRLRFHVTVTHKWEEYADVTSWDARLEDDKGHVYYPESKEKRKNEFRTKMWNSEMRNVDRNVYGDVTHVYNEGEARADGKPAPSRTTLSSFDTFHGEGDYVFHSKNIFNKDLKRLTLVMWRGGLEYRYTWNFADWHDPDDADHGLDQNDPWVPRVIPQPEQ